MTVIGSSKMPVPRRSIINYMIDNVDYSVKEYFRRNVKRVNRLQILYDK